MKLMSGSTLFVCEANSRALTRTVDEPDRFVIEIIGAVLGPLKHASALAKGHFIFRKRNLLWDHRVFRAAKTLIPHWVFAVHSDRQLFANRQMAVTHALTIRSVLAPVV